MFLRSAKHYFSFFHHDDAYIFFTLIKINFPSFLFFFIKFLWFLKFFMKNKLSTFFYFFFIKFLYFLKFFMKNKVFIKFLILTMEIRFLWKLWIVTVYRSCDCPWSKIIVLLSIRLLLRRKESITHPNRLNGIKKIPRNDSALIFSDSCLSATCSYV